MLKIAPAPMPTSEKNRGAGCVAPEVRAAVLGLADPLTAVSVHLSTVLRYLEGGVFDRHQAVAFARLAREEARRAVAMHQSIVSIETDGLELNY